ncbi:MAG TPA: response regulator transcription factor [Gemmatimonadales bacterium]|jgi:DNA-binding response OmpR family regulator
MAQAVPRRRVLFIEDEPALRLSYERAFALRYDAAYAATGAEALRLLSEHRPEVAVLDLRLPDTDGIDLLRQLRSTRPDLAVIITSAYVSLEPQLRVLAIPHHGYLVKPFDLADLARRIDAVG